MSIDIRGRTVRLLTAAFSALALSSAGAMAQDAENASGDSMSAPVVVELFTSQACSSCVAASTYFNELARRDDIVALGWHVDYWNLLNTKDGRWSDPYSKAAYTNRQRRYNINLRKRSSVYTPQMVVHGNGEAIGSERDKVGELISSAHKGAAPISLGVKKTEGAVSFLVSENQIGGNAYFIRFKPQVETHIKGGENAGLEFYETNVVTSVKPLGVVRLRGGEFSAPAPEAGDGCAFIIQEPGQGRILAARYCPE